MIIPFRRSTESDSHDAKLLILSAQTLLQFGDSFNSSCEDERTRVEILLQLQDITKRIENVAAALLTYKTACFAETLGARGRGE